MDISGLRHVSERSSLDGRLVNSEDTLHSIVQTVRALTRVFEMSAAHGQSVMDFYVEVPCHHDSETILGRAMSGSCPDISRHFLHAAFATHGLIKISVHPCRLCRAKGLHVLAEQPLSNNTIRLSCRAVPDTETYGGMKSQNARLRTLLKQIIPRLYNYFRQRLQARIPGARPHTANCGAQLSALSPPIKFAGKFAPRMKSRYLVHGGSPHRRPA